MRNHAHAAAVMPVDFRRPSRISRDAVIAIESRHDAFSRRLATIWSTRAHAMIEVEHVTTDQLSMDDFASSLPVPTALASIRVDRIGASAFVQVDLPLGLLFVERLLGGPGDATSNAVNRRPTDLESTLISQELLHPIVESIDVALHELDGDPSTLGALETTPQQLQLGAHGELLLMLTFRVEIRGTLPAQGLLTLAYPVSPLLTNLDQLLDAGRDAAAHRANAVVRDQLASATVDVHVQLAPSELPADAVASLEPGDVLRLDHRAHEPAHIRVDGRRVGAGYLGRRGRRVAVQVAEFTDTHAVQPLTRLATSPGIEEQP